MRPAALSSISGIDAIKNSLPVFFQNVKKPVSLHEPCFIGNESKYVQECIETGWVSSVGSFVDRFAKDLGSYTDTYATPIVNGTAALHLCLHIMGVEPDDEVLTPTLTFVATANAVRHAGAIPHFVDCEDQTFGVDAAKLSEYLSKAAEKRSAGLSNKATGRRIKALIVTHIYGHPADLDELCAVCRAFDLVLIEDAAESLGSLYKGKHTGGMGHIASLSFNGNKIVTTGGGGAVITKNRVLSDRARHLSTTARCQNPYSYMHDEMAFNYRMPNINAALGCAQLEKIDLFLMQKRNLAAAYQNFFKGLADISFLKEPENTRSNYWLNTILVKSEAERNDLIDCLARHGLQTRGTWRPMHLLPMFESCPRMDVSRATDLAMRSLNLPSSAQLYNQINVRD